MAPGWDAGGEERGLESDSIDEVARPQQAAGAADVPRRKQKIPSEADLRRKDERERTSRRQRFKQEPDYEQEVEQVCDAISCAKSSMEMLPEALPARGNTLAALDDYMIRLLAQFDSQQPDSRSATQHAIRHLARASIRSETQLPGQKYIESVIRRLQSDRMVPGHRSREASEQLQDAWEAEGIRLLSVTITTPVALQSFAHSFFAGLPGGLLPAAWTSLLSRLVGTSDQADISDSTADILHKEAASLSAESTRKSLARDRVSAGGNDDAEHCTKQSPALSLRCLKFNLGPSVRH